MIRSKIMPCLLRYQEQLCFWQHCFQGGLIFISSGSLVVAGIAEYFFNIQPCALCIYERWLFFSLIMSAGGYFVSGYLASLGLMGFSFQKYMRFLSTLILLAGCALTFYHVGVEHHWWPAPANCRGGVPQSETIAEFYRLLSQKQVIRCDQPGWLIFNISAVIWTFLMFLGLFFLDVVLFFVSQALQKKNCSDQ